MKKFPTKLCKKTKMNKQTLYSKNNANKQQTIQRQKKM